MILLSLIMWYGWACCDEVASNLQPAICIDTLEASDVNNKLWKLLYVKLNGSAAVTLPGCLHRGDFGKCEREMQAKIDIIPIHSFLSYD